MKGPYYGGIGFRIPGFQCQYICHIHVTSWSNRKKHVQVVSGGRSNDPTAVALFLGVPMQQQKTTGRFSHITKNTCSTFRGSLLSGSQFEMKRLTVNGLNFCKSWRRMNTNQWLVHFLKWLLMVMELALPCKNDAAWELLLPPPLPKCNTEKANEYVNTVPAWAWGQVQHKKMHNNTTTYVHIK